MANKIKNNNKLTLIDFTNYPRKNEENYEEFKIIRKVNKDFDSIKDKSLEELCKSDLIQFFPPLKDNILKSYKDNHILDCWYSKKKDTENGSLTTFGFVGFISCDNNELKIHSRFDTKVKNTSKSSKEEYNYNFLLYLLSRISGINHIDSKVGSGINNIFDLLPFMFPALFKEAMNQGLYRQYVTRKYNDSNVKGVINVSRHLKLNPIFNGKIAYDVRENTENNYVNRLIMATVLHIRKNSNIKFILDCDSEMRKFINVLQNATIDCNYSEKNFLIKHNIKKEANHPYFNKYKNLQKLCIQILRKDKKSYGSDDDKVHGILFDVPNLWEEYLNTILRKMGFKHPNNIEQTNGINLFNEDAYAHIGTRYPDFFYEENGETRLIIDAKYKNIRGDISNDYSYHDDINQMITYMYRLKCKKAILLYPYSSDDEKNEDLSKEIKWYKLHEDSYGNGKSKIGILGLKITPKESYEDFCEVMRKIEDNIETIIKENM